MKKLVRYFLQGLLYLAPLAITVYAIIMLFKFVDGLLQIYLTKWIGITIPGLGIIIIVSFLTILGYIGQTIIAQPFKILLGKLLNRAPIVKVIYSSLTDLFSAFVGKEKKFDKPVLVKVNTISELEKVGFLTQSELSILGIKDKVAVYFPHSYNFSGEMFIVPVEHVKPLNIPAAEAMKFIVSGGVTKMS